MLILIAMKTGRKETSLLSRGGVGGGDSKLPSIESFLLAQPQENWAVTTTSTGTEVVSDISRESSSSP